MGLIHVPNEELYNPPGIVGWWKFDEMSSGTNSDSNSIGDSSGMGNNGSPNSSVNYTTGIVGKGAIVFNGTNNIKISNSTSLNFNNGIFSLSFWVNAGTQIASYPAIISKNSGDMTSLPSNTLGWFVYFDGYYFKFRISDNAVYDTASLGTINNGNTNVVINVGTSNIIAYVSGGIISSLPRATSTNINANADLSIGRWEYFNRHFVGVVDDVRLYNRILSQSEITKLYTSS